MDFGKYQYQEQKRSREAKKHQRVIEVKEIKFRPKVDEHDYDFKKKHIERFLAHGRQGEGDDLLPRPRDGASGHRPPHSGASHRGTLRGAMPETSPRMEGNQMHVILSARAGRKSAPKRAAQEAVAEPVEE
jgi:translation initiation factor IF-3